MTSRAYELSQTLDIDGDQHITGNTIVTGDLTFSGAGYMRVPVGTTADRPTTIAEAGQVRYNTDLGKYEGYHDAEWLSFGDLIDKDHDTKITVHDGWGQDNDELTFFTACEERLKITNTGDFQYTAVNMTLDAAETVITGNLTIQGETTTIKSTTVTVDDKILELSDHDTKTTSTADGSGIQVNDGTDNHNVLWSTSGTKWVISDNAEVAGDLLVTGNQITFGNAESINNDSDGTIKIASQKLQLGGNMITNSANEDTIGLDGNQNVILENKLKVKGDIIQSSDGSDAIVFGTGGTVAIGAGSPAENKIFQASDSNGTGRWVTFGVYDVNGTRVGP